MAEQERTQKSTHDTNTTTIEQDETEETTAEGFTESEETDMDALLDDIDDLLEQENAEEFVENYIQRGGQ